MEAEDTGTPAGTGTGRRRFLGTVAGLTAAAGTGLLSIRDPGPARATHRPEPRPPRIRPLFLGTYTSVPGGGTGVGFGTYDTVTGQITAGGVVAGVADPSYLALAPSGRTLYTVNEQEQGGVTAMALGPGGPPAVLGTRSTGGAGPCHLSVHPGGRWLLSANYLSGSVAVHPVDRATGALGERTDLVTHSSPPPGPGQDGPHAHQIRTAPDGRHVLAVDLGNDTVYTYRLDTSAGKLTEVSSASLRPGAAPGTWPSIPPATTPTSRTRSTTRSWSAATTAAADGSPPVRRSPPAPVRAPAIPHSSWSPGAATSPISPIGGTTA